jgi:hypothetical protein
MYKDKIVMEVRKARNKIELEVGDSISSLHKYFMDKQSSADPAKIRRLPRQHKIKTAA